MIFFQKNRPKEEEERNYPAKSNSSKIIKRSQLNWNKRNKSRR